MVTVIADNVSLSQAKGCVEAVKSSNQNKLHSCFDEKLMLALSIDKKNTAETNQYHENSQVIIYPFINQDNQSLKKLVKTIINKDNSGISNEPKIQSLKSSDNLFDIKNLISNFGSQNEKMAAIISQKNNTIQKNYHITNNVTLNKSKVTDINNENLLKIEGTNKAETEKNNSSNAKVQIKSKILLNNNIIDGLKEKPNVKLAITQSNRPNKVVSNEIPAYTGITTKTKINKELITQKNDEIPAYSGMTKINNKLINSFQVTGNSNSNEISNNEINLKISENIKSNLYASDKIIQSKDADVNGTKNLINSNEINKNIILNQNTLLNKYDKNEKDSIIAKQLQNTKSGTSSENTIKNNDNKINITNNKFKNIDKINPNSNSNLVSVSNKSSQLKNNVGQQVVLTGAKSEDIIPRTLNIIKNLPNNTNTQAKLLLKPASLGTVMVDISIKDNIVNLKFRADSQDVVKSIESQIEQLKDKMNLQGLKVETIEVNINQKDYENQSKNDLNDNQQSNNNNDKELRQSFLNSFKNLDTEDENFINKNNFISQNNE